MVFAVSLLLGLAWASSSALAFTYSYGAATQCGQMNLSWTGGTAPFTVELVPAFGSQSLVNIPSNAFSNGKGSYQFTLPYKQGQKFVMAMSDTSGNLDGGVTNVITTGAAAEGAPSCNTTSPGIDFSFELDSALQQCASYPFSDFSGGTPPYTITAFIPGGDTFSMSVPAGSASFNWVADVAAGTSVIFTMSDSQGKVGGASDVETVANSNDASCLNGQSPSSTANPPSLTHPTATSTSTSKSSGTAPATTTVVSGSPTASGGAIAGTVVGGLLALAILVTLGLFFLRRYQDKSRRATFYDGKGWRQSRRMDAVDLSYDGATHTTPNPFTSPPSSSAQESGPNSYASRPTYATNAYSQRQSGYDSRESAAYDGIELPSSMYADSSNGGVTSHEQQLSPFGGGGHTHEFSARPYSPGSVGANSYNDFAQTSSRQSKATEAASSGYQPSTRLVVHQDLSDVSPAGSEVVEELPPQYSSSRRPLQLAGQYPGSGPEAGPSADPWQGVDVKRPLP